MKTKKLIIGLLLFMLLPAVLATTVTNNGITIIAGVNGGTYGSVTSSPAGVTITADISTGTSFSTATSSDGVSVNSFLYNTRYPCFQTAVSADGASIVASIKSGSDPYDPNTCGENAEPLLSPDGSTCTANGDCTSGNCDIEWDSATSYCHATAASCINYTTAIVEYTDGNELCSAHAWYKSCSSGLWGSQQNSPDTANDYCSGQGDAQGGYDLLATCASGASGGFTDPACVACTNGYRATTAMTGCNANCNTNDDTKCIGTYHCDVSACAADHANTLACENDADCTSGNCDADPSGVKYCHATSTSCVAQGGATEIANAGTTCYNNDAFTCGSGTWSSTDCAAVSSTDSDSGNFPLTGGYVTDTNDACSGGACTTTARPDTCSANTLTEYMASAATYTTQNYDCNTYDTCFDSTTKRDYSCIDTTYDYCGYTDTACYNACGYYLDVNSCTSANCIACGTTCTLDNQCDSNAHCQSNVCVADHADGTSCEGDGACTSANCDADFAGSPSYCHATASSCVDYALGTPWERATGYELCSGNAYYKSCTSSAWGTQQNSPDTANDYCSGQGDAQGGYDLLATCTSGASGGFTDPSCTACTNGYRALTTMDGCFASCATNDDTKCIGTYHCDVSACAADHANTVACENDADCSSGNCDADPSGAKFCHATSTSCVDVGGATEIVNAGKTCYNTDSYTCTSSVWSAPTDCANTCGYYPTVDTCTLGTCGSCATSCAGDGNCDANAHCQSLVCVADHADGTSCEGDGACTSSNCDADFPGSPSYCHATATSCVDYALGTPWERATGYELCSGNAYYKSCSSSVWGSQVACDTTNDYCDAGGGAQSGYDLAETCSSGATGECQATSCTSCSPHMAASTSTCMTTCTGDAQCWTGYYCGGSDCLAKKSNGQSCTADNECSTGNCDADFAGSPSYCHATATSCTYFAGGTPWELATGYEQCSGNAYYKSCTSSVWGSQVACDTTNDYCTAQSDGQGGYDLAETCTSGATGGCQATSCTACTSGYRALATKDGCFADCITNDDIKCIGPSHCDVSACAADHANTVACENDVDCTSGNCDADPTGAKFCHATSTRCPDVGGATEIVNAGKTCYNTDSYTCTSSTWSAPTDCANTCGYYPTVDTCTLGVCGTCATSCSLDGDCDSNAHCQSNVCVADHADGTSCESDAACTSANCDADFAGSPSYCHATATSCVDYALGTPWERATGYELCSGNAYYKSCTSSAWGSQVACDTTNDYCTAQSDAQGGYDLAETCTSGATGGCQATSCTACTGGYRALTTKDGCFANCNTNDDTKCIATSHCSASNTCAADFSNTQSCVEDSDCSSGNCDADPSGAKFCHATATSCVEQGGATEVVTTGKTCYTGDSYTCTNSVWSAPTDCLNTCGYYPTVDTCTAGTCGSCATTCASDANCDANGYCDGSSHCVANLTNGNACTRDRMCVSGNCDADFAGSPSYCHATSTSCVYYAGGNPWELATGYEQCSGNAYYKSCSSSAWGSQVACDTTNDYCDAGGGAQSGYDLAETCTSGATGGCNPTSCTSCSPHMAASTSTCMTTCTGDSQCWTGYYCGGSDCTVKPPVIKFVTPTPVTGYNTTANSVPINISLTDANLKQLIKNWNGVDYTFYNDSLVLMMNLDNRSVLGDNLTFMKDLSKWANNGWRKYGLNFSEVDRRLYVSTWGTWMHLHQNIYPNSESVTNWAKTYTYVRDVDYNLNYTTGSIRPITGSQMQTDGCSPCAISLRYDNTNPVYADGKYGKALNFDGLDDYACIPDSNSLDVRTNLTFGAWIYPKSTGGQLVAKVNVWSGYSYGFYLSGGKIVFQTYSGARGTRSVTSTSSIPLNQWTYVMVNYQNLTSPTSNNTVRIYLNGNLDKQDTNFYGLASEYATPNLALGATGCEGPPQGGFFNGTIDEVRIWNRTLSAAEIKQQYYSNLYKYDTDKWNLYEAESLPEPLGTKNYTYYSCAKNTLGGQNCTETRHLTSQAIIPAIKFVSPTPANGASTVNTSISLNISVTESNFNQLTKNWNGKNYTFYNDSLIFMMNLDDVSALGESSTKVLDVSKYANNGTFAGTPTWVQGKYGKALDFDADTDYVSVPDSTRYTLTGEYTVSAWINPDDIANDYKGIFGTFTSGSNGFIFTLRNTASNELSFWAGGTWRYSGYTIAENGVWKYVAYTRKGTVGTFYVNGVNVSTVAALSGGDGGELQVGGGGTGWPNYRFDGKIDEPRIYSRALSADELKQMYNSNINKYNTDKWTLYENETGISAGTYTYYACAKDTAGNQNCTATMTLNALNANGLACTSDSQCQSGNCDLDVGGVTSYCHSTATSCVYYAGGSPWEVATGGYFSRYMCSNSVWTYNNAPTQAAPLLNATTKYNLTTDDLTCWNKSTADTESNSVKNIYNWLINGKRAMILNAPFEGNSTSTFTKDYSGSVNNGVVSGATWSATGGFDGKGAYQFNGKTSTIQFAYNRTASQIQSQAISAWFYRIGPGLGDVQGIVTILSSSNQNAQSQMIYTTSTGLVSCGGAYTGGGLVVNSSVASNTWNNVVCVSNYAGGVMTESIYVNGIFAGSVARSESAYQYAANLIRVGAQKTTSFNRYFNGTIDDVQIWNRSISSQEVAALYASQKNSKIVSQDTTTGDVWQCSVTPNDFYGDGTTLSSNSLTVTGLGNGTVCSADIDCASGNCDLDWNSTTKYCHTTATSCVYIAGGSPYEVATGGSAGRFNCSNTVWTWDNYRPTQTTPVLSATTASNWTSDNLTCYNQSTADLDSDVVKNIYGWTKNSTSIFALNLPFEGGSNSTFTKDYSGFGYNGVVTGATWNRSAGYDGKGAYKFDGINDRITSSNIAPLGNSYSISTWVNTRKISSVNEQVILNLYSVPAALPGVVLSLTTSQTVRFTHRVPPAGAGGSTVYSAASYYPGTWMHIVAEFANGNITLYINGVKDNVTNATGAINFTSIAHIGRHPTSGRYFNGTIDEFKIYNSALSPEQVKALYQNKTNLIVSQETFGGNVWQCSVTPNDGYADGTTLSSNSLTVNGYLNGEECTLDSQCDSGNCDLDFDTLLNFCHAAPTACVDFTLGNPWERADGYELCSGNAWYKSCALGAWGVQVDSPDLYNDYCTAQDDTQGGYDLAATCASGDAGGFTDPGCTACTVGYRATTSKNACYTNCATNDDLRCISDYHCADGDVCAQDLPPTSECVEDSDCSSNHCREDYDPGDFCSTGNTDCMHDGVSFNHGDLSGDYQCDNGVWELQCNDDWTDVEEGSIDMDLKLGESCYYYDTDDQSFQVNFYVDTLHADSIDNGGYIKQLLVGEENPDNKWCLYIWNPNSGRVHSTMVYLTEEQGASPYCDGVGEVLVHSFFTGHTNQAAYTSEDDYMKFEYDSTNDFVKVSVFDNLLGENAKMVLAYSNSGESPSIFDSAVADGFSGTMSGDEITFNVPEFSTAGIVLAVLLVLAFMLLMKGKANKRKK